MRSGRRWLGGASLLLLGSLLTALPASAQSGGYTPADLIPMGQTRGEKVNRLVLRNATMISGRGTPGTNRAMPPEGPVDIVIEGNRIVDIVLADAVNARNVGGGDFRPTGDRVIDVQGMYVMPGLVEMHAHLPPDGGELGPHALDYTYRLYLGHGVTTVRDAGTGAGMQRMVEQRRASDRGELIAPRLVLCQRWPLPLRSWNEGNTPQKARAQVQQYKQMGADCVKISKSPGQYPDVLAAAVDESKKQGMFVMVDLKVSETDARVASDAGVLSIEHWYGVPDAALLGTQSFPTDYNYWDELDRFRYAGKLWAEADQRPDRIDAVLELMMRNGTNWNPTMVVYEKNRDYSRSRTLPHRETLYHPSKVEVLPDESVHGAFHREWKTSDEISWRNNFQIWMSYVKRFHEMGGLLTAGSDDGAIGGISMIRELELLQEAGIHPLDVIKVATTNAYQVLGMTEHCGVRVGCVADLVVVNGNPVDNFKVMYGRGYGLYGILPAGEREKVAGVKYTIKDGIVYDAQALLREAEWYVVQERERLAGGTGPITTGH